MLKKKKKIVMMPVKTQRILRDKFAGVVAEEIEVLAEDVQDLAVMMTMKMKRRIVIGPLFKWVGK